MEVILRQHVDNLGRRGEIVKVADGYARNYLLPRKLALPATEGNRKHVERERKIMEAREAEEKGQAAAIATALPAGANIIANEKVSSPGEAAFANAVLGHGLVREDMHAASIAHLGVVVWPVVLATAHPSKFPDAVEAAAGVRPALPGRMAGLMAQPERVTRVANDVEAIKELIGRETVAEAGR